MKKVYQETPTDCLRACISSILNIPYKKVPVFFGSLESSCYGWLAVQGITVNAVLPHHKPIKNQLYISVRANVKWDTFAFALLEHSFMYPCHATLGKNGKMIHDPASKLKGAKLPKYEVQRWYLVSA